MRCFLQLGLILLLLLGVGTRAWCRGAVSPQATAPGFAADRTLRHGPDTPPALLASGAAAMWGRDVATAGISLRDSTPATAGPVIVSIRRTALCTCPSAPPPPSASGSTTNPVWVAVGFNLYAYCDGDPGSKWLSRDPIEEDGGTNLYAFVNNDPVNLFDVLGQQPAGMTPAQQLQALVSFKDYDSNFASAKLSDQLIQTFNCAGLATRSFTFMGLNDLKLNYLTKGRPLKNCSEKCNKCQIKFWLWEYDLHVEINVNGQILKSAPNSDFHVVSGRSSCVDGSDQVNVYSKNGARPVIGPGLGSNFKPALNEQRQSNDARASPLYFDTKTSGQTITNTGYPVMGIRNNMKESCHCLDASNTNGR
jgi:hypothetical protein